MPEKSDKTKTGRRDFLRFAGLGAVAGGALVATGGKPAEAVETTTGKPKACYRETELVKTYYDLARF